MQLQQDVDALRNEIKEMKEADRLKDLGEFYRPIIIKYMLC